jgi:acyl-CoA thioesterase
LRSRDASADTFGIELVSAAADRAVASMPVRSEMCNGFGILHGGMTFLLADSAMAFASNAEAGTEEAGVALASSAEIDWLAPVSAGDVLTATAERRWAGGRSALWDVTVTNAAGEVVAIMRGRTRRTAGQANSDPR